MTTLYAVRTIEEKRPLGFIYAASLKWLAEVVDTKTNGSLCEYKAIRAPAAIWFERRPLPGNGNYLDDYPPWKMGVADDLDERPNDDDCEAFERRHAMVRGDLEFDAGDARGLWDMLSGEDEITGWRPLEDTPETKLMGAFERPKTNAPDGPNDLPIGDVLPFPKPPVS